MKTQSVIKGSVILMASVVFAKLCGALFRIPLTQLLGGTGMGYFSSAYGVFLPVFALSVTGMNTAVATLTAEAAAESNHAEIRAVRSCALRLFGLLGVIGTVMLFAFAAPVCRHLLGNPPATLAVQMLSPTVCICCISAVYRGCCEGLRCMTPTALSQCIEGIMRVLCGVMLCRLAISGKILLGAGDTLADGAAAAIFGVTISAAAGLLFLVCVPFHVPKARISQATRKTVYRRLIRILIPVAVSSLVTNLTTLTDLFTVLHCLTDVILKVPAQFGYTALPSHDEAAATANFLYGAFSGLAVTVFNLVPSVTNMMGKSVLPAFADASARGDGDAMRRDACTALSATAFLCIPAGLGIFALAKPILMLLFPARTAEVAAAAPPLMILGIAVIFLALTQPVFSMLQAAGYANQTVWVMLWGLGIKLVGNLLLMRHAAIHLNGAAIATLLCYAVILLRGFAVLRQKTAIEIPMLRICGKPLIAGALCAITARITYGKLFYLGNAPALLIAIACGAVVYLLVSLCLRTKN